MDACVDEWVGERARRKIVAERHMPGTHSASKVRVGINTCGGVTPSTSHLQRTPRSYDQGPPPPRTSVAPGTSVTFIRIPDAGPYILGVPHDWTTPDKTICID